MADPSPLAAPDAEPRWESRWIELPPGGTRIHHIDLPAREAAGAGRPPIVLVHGIGGSLENWMYLAPALARRHRVLALDLPAHGLSHPLPRDFGVNAYQTVVDGFIAATAGDRPVILLGHSMGGLISLLEAARHPERLARLILMSPAAPPPWGELLRLRTIGWYLAWAAPGMLARYMGRRSRRVPDEAVVRAILRFCYAPGTEPGEEVVAAHVRLQERRRREMPWVDRGLTRTARSIVSILQRRRRYRRIAASLRLPTLLVGGTADRVVPYPAEVALARLRPDWSFATLPGVGHLPQLEQPERCLEVIESWLEADPTPAAAGASL
jgi:pimeloyl-ACP methyl ester carboxylesterase